MLATVALYGICTAYLVSSGPVGIRMCRVLCYRDCSCSAPSYDSRQMTCNFKLSSGVPATWNGMTCPSRSCRAVHNRRGTALCVKKNASIKREKIMRKKTSKRFKVTYRNTLISLSKKGIDVEFVQQIIIKQDPFVTFSFTYLSPDGCESVMTICSVSSYSRLTVRAEKCKKRVFYKKMKEKILSRAYVYLTLTKQEMRLCLSHPHKTSRYVFTEVMAKERKCKDLLVKGSWGNDMIIEVFTYVR